MTVRYNPLLLGIHGAPQAGKDETFTRVEKWALDYMHSTRRRGFADKLKWSLARIFYPDISMEDAIIWCNRLKLDPRYSIGVIRDYNDPTHQSIEHAILMRNALRYFGTESVRDIFGDNFWVDQLLPVGMIGPDDFEVAWHREFQRRSSISPAGTTTVADICGITDLRFPNEAERVKHLRGTLVKVRNDEAVEKMLAKTMKDGKKLHRSDLELPDELFDVILDNNNWRTRPEYLTEQVVAMMEERTAA